MTNKEMLKKVRLDRPQQVIHEVLNFKEIKCGFFDVNVDMEIMFLETKVKHGKTSIPYPISEFNKFTEEDTTEGDKFDYRWKYML